MVQIADEPTWPVPDDPRSLDRDRRAFLAERAGSAGASHRWRGSDTVKGLGLALALLILSSALVWFVNRADPPQPPPLNPDPSGAVGHVGGLLPDGKVLVSGHWRENRDLRPAVLVLVPADCDRCDALVASARQEADALGGAVLTSLDPPGDGALRLEDPWETLVPLSARASTVVVAADGTIVDVRRDRGLRGRH